MREFTLKILLLTTEPPKSTLSRHFVEKALQEVTKILKEMPLGFEEVLEAEVSVNYIYDRAWLSFHGPLEGVVTTFLFEKDLDGELHFTHVEEEEEEEEEDVGTVYLDRSSPSESAKIMTDVLQKRYRSALASIAKAIKDKRRG